MRGYGDNFFCIPKSMFDYGFFEKPAIKPLTKLEAVIYFYWHQAGKSTPKAHGSETDFKHAIDHFTKAWRWERDKVFDFVCLLRHWEIYSANGRDLEFKACFENKIQELIGDPNV